MNKFFQMLMEKLDLWIVLIVLCSGFFQKLYMKGIQFSKDKTYDSALKTLLLSALASAIFVVLARDPNSATNWAKYFISYFTATSLYELLIAPFIAAIKKATGQEGTKFEQAGPGGGTNPPPPPPPPNP